MQCEKCGVQAPTAPVVFRQNIGLVLLHLMKKYEGHFCKDCIKGTYWNTFLINLFFGWWGIKSFFITPVYLILNTIKFVQTSKLEPVPINARSSAGLAEGDVDKMMPYTKDIITLLAGNNPRDRIAAELSTKAGVTYEGAKMFVQEIINQANENKTANRL